MRVDHIGIAVRSIDEALGFYEKAFGAEVMHREEVPSQNVRVAFLGSGETTLELMEPTSEEGAVAKFLKSRGPGLHHVAFKVEDVGAKMEDLRKDGLPPLQSRPRPGARGHHVCFLHPKLSGGVLVELVGA